MRASDETSRTRPPRVVWLAGSRGEILSLGPLFLEARRRSQAGTATHFLLDAGEQGMAMQQALDFLGIVPDETAPLCHPADEPAVRLKLMLERAEAFARQRKATHVVFTGAGALAAGAALACHGRNTPGLWLAPADPAGQIDRLRLESGFIRTIHACAPAVSVWPWPAVPLLPEDLPENFGDCHRSGIPGTAAVPVNSPQSRPWRPEDEIAGISPWSPLAIVAVLRREWGIRGDTTGAVVRAAAAWAARRTDLQWLLLSNLSQRIEGPLQALKERPLNLKSAPPLPYPLYRSLLTRCRVLVTDSARMTAEAERLGVPTLLLGETNGTGSERRELISPENLTACDAAVDRLSGLPAGEVVVASEPNALSMPSDVVERWITQMASFHQA